MNLPKQKEAEDNFIIPYQIPSAKFQDLSLTSKYIQMRDGTKIAIDIYLPNPIQKSEKFPTILHCTQFWRRVNLRKCIKQSVPSIVKFFVEQGYAYVIADARGTGASFGVPYPFSFNTIDDGSDIIKWIHSQSWSNRKVGAHGYSFDGIIPLFFTLSNPPVDAIIPRYTPFDIYSELFFPGGVAHSSVTKNFSTMINRLNQNKEIFAGWLSPLFIKGVQPVAGESGESLLQKVIIEHKTNIVSYESILNGSVQYRDDYCSELKGKMESINASYYLIKNKPTQTGFYCHGGWYDGANALSAIKTFLFHKNQKKQLILGPWIHMGLISADPLYGGRSSFNQNGEMLRFFNANLLLGKEDRNYLIDFPVKYYTVNQKKWKFTKTWPPPVKSLCYYFSPEHQLNAAVPKNYGKDDYQVDYSIGTGRQWRWDTIINPSRNNKIEYQYANANYNKQLLIYTSKPLNQDLILTGHPIINLYMSSTKSDGNLFVYLDEITEEGKINNITEGVFRVSHRKILKTDLPWNDFIPGHSYNKNDSMPLQPNEVSLISFDLLPISYLIKKNHQIRLVISGADKDHFPHINESDPPLITLHRTSDFLSHIVLPIEIQNYDQ